MISILPECLSMHEKDCMMQMHAWYAHSMPRVPYHLESQTLGQACQRSRGCIWAGYMCGASLAVKTSNCLHCCHGICWMLS